MRHPILRAATAFAVTASVAALVACSGGVSPSALPAVGSDRQTESGRALPGGPSEPGGDYFNAVKRPGGVPSPSPSPNLGASRTTHSGRALPGGGTDGTVMPGGIVASPSPSPCEHPHCN